MWWTSRSREAFQMMMSRRGVLVSALSLIVLTTLTPSSSARESVHEQVKLELLDRINRDRERHGLAPVLIDSAASRIADSYCGAQVENGTRGHFTTDGLAPYMRFSFAGIHDAVLENAAAWSARAIVPDALISELAQKSHSAMIAELPPDDGHRKAILDPHATHVGIGLAWGGKEVRLVEVLLRRHLEWRSKRQRAFVGETVRYEARLLDPATVVEDIRVHYEPFPYRLSRERANSIDSYGLPAEWLRLERSRSASPLDAATRRLHSNPAYDLKGDQLSFDLSFSNGRGVYTIVVWVRSPDDSHSFEATNLSVLVDSRSGATTGLQ